MLSFFEQFNISSENFINETNIAAYYDRFGSRGVFPSTRQAPRANMGYWKGIDPMQPHALDLATDAFFSLISRTAEISEQDIVVDAGCGYGTNAIYCMQHFAPQKIIGLNLSQAQINVGQNLVDEAQLSNQVTLMKCSALTMPFTPSSIDKILCIEAASHFRTREDFFHKAHEALRPGGILTLADFIIPPAANLPQQVLLSGFRHLFQFPKENIYDKITYLAKLKAAGFEIIETYSMYQDIIPPFTQWIRHHAPPPFPGYNLLGTLGLKIYFSYPLDYVCLKARKVV